MTENLSIAQLMNNMPKVFRAERAEGVDADIQFKFDGQEPGAWVLGIHNGAATMTEGETANPTASIEAPSEVWRAIALGQSNAMTAFMTGQLKATGDMGLLMRMQGMFG